MPHPSVRADVLVRRTTDHLDLDRDRLDQHLLADPATVERVVALARPDAGVVVDLGAGPGTLAAAVAPAARTVIAVELDVRFGPMLREVRDCHPNVAVVFADLRRGWPAGQEIVASPPWGLLELLAGRLVSTPPHAATLIVSESFAEAIAARPGDAAFGRASVYVQSTFRTYRHGSIAPAAFVPAPRRPAALVRLEYAPAVTDIRRLAAALAGRGRWRTRDLAARLGRPATSLPGRPQRRLQELTSEELAGLWVALGGDEPTSRE